MGGGKCGAHSAASAASTHGGRWCRSAAGRHACCCTGAGEAGSEEAAGVCCYKDLHPTMDERRARVAPATPIVLVCLILMRPGRFLCVRAGSVPRVDERLRAGAAAAATGGAADELDPAAAAGDAASTSIAACSLAFGTGLKRSPRSSPRPICLFGGSAWSSAPGVFAGFLFLP